MAQARFTWEAEEFNFIYMSDTTEAGAVRQSRQSCARERESHSSYCSCCYPLDSDIYAIKRAFQLRISIEMFTRENCTDISDYSLSAADWDELKEIAEILEPFEEATRELEGYRRYRALYDVVSSMEILNFHLKDCKTRYKSRFIQKSLELAITKLKKYHDLVDNTPVLYAAVILNPSLKMKVFERVWKDYPNQIVAAREAVKALWLEEYKEESQLEAPEPKLETKLESLRKKVIDDGFVDDELEDYMSSKTVRDVEDPQAWWQSHRKTYPQLSVMALDIMAIPAMSAEVERVFSSSKLTITDRRNRLKEDIIEGIECQKSWLKGGTASLPEIEEVQRAINKLKDTQI